MVTSLESARKCAISCGMTTGSCDGARAPGLRTSKEMLAESARARSSRFGYPEEGSWK